VLDDHDGNRRPTIVISREDLEVTDSQDAVSGKIIEDRNDDLGGASPAQADDEDLSGTAY